MRIKTKTIGTIVSFDPVTQFATVKLSCNGTNSTLDANYYNQEGLTLVDVPVEFSRCGEFVITFPVRPGDDCIVEFFEQGITHWLYENRRAYKVVNGRPEAAARRKFDRQDAVCRVSMGNLEGAIPGFDTSSFQVRSMSGGQHMTFFPNGDIKLKTSTKIMVDAEDIEMKASNIKMDASKIKMTADEIDMNGATVDASGMVKSPTGMDSPSMKAGGKELANHKHPGVQPGDGETGVNK